MMLDSKGAMRLPYFQNGLGAKGKKGVEGVLCLSKYNP